jgi:hypothetical protein
MISIDDHAYRYHHFRHSPLLPGVRLQPIPNSLQAMQSAAQADAGLSRVNIGLVKNVV